LRSVCLFVCLSVCLCFCFWNRWTDLRQIFVQIPCGRNSVLLWRSCDTGAESDVCECLVAATSVSSFMAAQGMGLGAKPPSPKMSLSFHSETDWSRIKQLVNCATFSNFYRPVVKICKQCLQLLQLLVNDVLQTH